jgi:polyisoprenyl-phosphate glycosyltransferase
MIDPGIAPDSQLLTVSIPLFNSEKNIRRAYQVYVDALEKAGIPFEMLMFDDGSKDNTWAVMQQLAAADKRIRIFRMSRNYTPPYLQFAALSVCRGACITFMPDDLQRPVETMVECYRLWKEGHKLIIPYRNSRDDGWLSDQFSSWYYRIMNRLSDVQFPPGGADGYLADREIIDIMRLRGGRAGPGRKKSAWPKTHFLHRRLFLSALSPRWD